MNTEILYGVGARVGTAINDLRNVNAHIYVGTYKRAHKELIQVINELIELVTELEKLHERGVDAGTTTSH